MAKNYWHKPNMARISMESIFKLFGLLPKGATDFLMIWISPILCTNKNPKKKKKTPNGFLWKSLKIGTGDHPTIIASQLPESFSWY